MKTLANTAAAILNAPQSARTVLWQERYDGLAVTAYVAGQAVAGISGPWDGRFALTRWDRPISLRRLELFLSLDEAKRAVEWSAVGELRIAQASAKRAWQQCANDAGNACA